MNNSSERTMNDFWERVKQESLEACKKYTKSLKDVGFDKTIRVFTDFDTVANATNEDWALKCARSGIGILNIRYFPESHYETVVSFEFQWRYGEGDGERRWAKSVLSLKDELSSNAVCMLVYDKVKELRKGLEG